MTQVTMYRPKLSPEALQGLKFPFQGCTDSWERGEEGAKEEEEGGGREEEELFNSCSHYHWY